MSGFESGGQHSPSIIAPWSIIGDDSMLKVSTDFSSCFKQNPIALRMEVVCDDHVTNICPDGGVGIYNPDHWGIHLMKFEILKVLKILPYFLFVSFAGSKDFEEVGHGYGHEDCCD